MACVGLWIPSLTRLLLYFGTKRMISLASACKTGMAARALSRVMMVVLSDVYAGIGIAHVSLGNYQEALTKYTMALDVAFGKDGKGKCREHASETWRRVRPKRRATRHL